MEKMERFSQLNLWTHADTQLSFFTSSLSVTLSCSLFLSLELSFAFPQIFLLVLSNTTASLLSAYPFLPLSAVVSGGTGVIYPLLLWSRFYCLTTFSRFLSAHRWFPGFRRHTSTPGKHSFSVFFLALLLSPMFLTSSLSHSDHVWPRCHQYLFDDVTSVLPWCLIILLLVLWFTSILSQLSPVADLHKMDVFRSRCVEKLCSCIHLHNCSQNSS